MRDIFISYSHKDNLTLTDEQLGWVDRFHRALHVRLTQLLGRDSTVFFDKAVMTGSDVLSPKIRGEVADAKLLVSIVSPGYLMSNWCNEELHQFAAAAATGSGVVINTTSRIVKILKLPVEPELEKRAKIDLSDVLGYKFYRVDKRGVASEFDLDDEPQSRREFIKRVNELAYDIRKTLAMFGDENPNRGEMVPATGKTVYLAETSSDLAGEAERLRSELTQYGHAVVPERFLPHGPSIVETVRAELAKADLSVHLVGAAYAAVPERHHVSLDELQFDLAVTEVERRPAFRRLIWSPQNLAIDDERQQHFLARLDSGAQRVITPFETFKQSVRAALEAPPVVEHSTAPAAADGARQASIYFVFDLSDRELVQPLDDALFGSGFDVLSPIFEGDEARIRKHDERCLVECDAVLIFAGNAPADWLSQRVIDLQKAPALGRTHGFLARGVAIGPPRSIDKDRFRRQSVIKMELYDGRPPSSSLEPFLFEIERARAAGA